MRGYPGVRAHDDFEQALFATRERPFDIALEQRGKWLCRLPFRMLWREGFHAIKRKEELEVERLLRPERAIIVERSDTFGPARFKQASKSSCMLNR